MIGSDAKTKRDRGGKRKEQRELDAAVLRVHRLGVALLAQLPRDGRQQDGAETDADQPERKLVQPIGIVNVGDRAGVEQAAGERGRDREIDLHRAGAERRRQDQPKQLAANRRSCAAAGSQLTPACRQASISQPSWSTPPTVTEIACARAVT